MRHPSDDMREERLRQEGIELDGKSLGPTPSTGPAHPGGGGGGHRHGHHRIMAVWRRRRHGELCGGHGGGLLQRPRESFLVRFVIDIKFQLFDLGKVAVNVFFVLVVVIASAVIVVVIAVVIMIAIAFVVARRRRLLQRSYSHVIRSSSSGSIFVDRLGGGAAFLGCFLPRFFISRGCLGGTHYAVVGDCTVPYT